MIESTRLGRILIDNQINPDNRVDGQPYIDNQQNNEYRASVRTTIIDNTNTARL